MSDDAVWSAELVVARAHIPAFEAVLDGHGLAFTTMEEPPNPEPLKPAPYWRLQVLVAGEPDRAELEAMVAAAAEVAGLPPPPVAYAAVGEHDWVSETNRLHAPVRIGRFVLHGSHDAEKVMRRADVLRIDAGRAFGTGRHYSTAGCLRLIENLAKRRKLGSVLDLGSGSGVLALAAHRLGAHPVIGSDIDPVATLTAQENARANEAGAAMRFVTSIGYANRALAGRYDLIIANILSGPLIGLAQATWRHAAPGAHVILSGLLAEEEPRVRARYRAAGFAAAGRVRDSGWVSLLFRRHPGRS